jgi:hypothetical protein
MTANRENEDWQLAEIEEATREADEHPEQMIKHEDEVADLLARGLVTQESLDRAEREVSLEELQRTQQASARP